MTLFTIFYELYHEGIPLCVPFIMVVLNRFRYKKYYIPELAATTNHDQR